MLRYLRSRLYKRLFVLATVIALTTGAPMVGAQSPDDGGVSYDGGGEEVLQSIFVPLIAHAPFSLTLAAEWSRPMNNGGTFTTANSRPIKRDSVGRLYQERWLMSPKGSNIPSQMSWIQIADPVEHTLLQCNPRQKVCELLKLADSVTTARFDPSRIKVGDDQRQQGG